MRFFPLMLVAFIGSALAIPNPSDLLGERGECTAREGSCSSDASCCTSLYCIEGKCNSPEAKREACSARTESCTSDATCCTSLYCIDGKCSNPGEKRELQANEPRQEGCSNGTPCLDGWTCQDGTCVEGTMKARDENPISNLINFSARNLFKKEACRGEITACGGSNPPCCKDYHCDQGYCVH